MAEVDWSALKKSADDAMRPAPPGDHVVEIRKSEAVTNSSGNPMYKVQGVIVSGPAEGKTVFNNFNVTPESQFAMAIFFQHMAALGLDDAFFATGPNHAQVAQALIGRRAVWTLDIRQWQGRDRNEVKSITALSGPLAQSVGGVTAGPATPGMPPTPSTPKMPAGPATPPHVGVMTPSAPATPPPVTPFDIPRG